MFLERTDPVATEFDRITQRLFGTSETGTSGLPMDVLRTDEGLVVRIDVPGVAPEHLGLRLDDGVLTVTAERHAELAEGDRVLLHERFDGSLARRLRVPDWVDAGRVEAEHDAGVLTIRMPMAERARPRTIEVRSGAKQIDAEADAA